MNSADTSCGENSYACAKYNPTRGSDCGGTIPSGCNCDRKITRTDLFYAICFGEQLDLTSVETDSELAIDDSNSCGYCAALANDCLQVFRSFQVCWSGQTMCDNRRLQRDNGFVVAECSRHIGHNSYGHDKP